jgi:hypothetical protein
MMENLFMKKLLPFIIIMISLVAHAQRVGIGTTTPNAKLEIVGEGNNSLTNNLLLKNSVGDTLIRIRNDGRMNLRYNGASVGRTLQLGGNGVNFYIDDATFSGSIFPTDTSVVMWSQIADNNYVILQPSWGKVGIGTYSPKAKLDVNDDFKLGISGTVLQRIIKISILRNITTVAANTSVIETFTVTGALVDGTVYISPDLELPDGLIIAYARVTAANTVEVKFTNVTAASVNPASMNYHITVIN